MLVYVPYLTSWTSLAAKAMRKTVVSLVQRITDAIWKKAIDLVEPEQVESDAGVPEQVEPDDDEIMNYEELLEYIKSLNMSVVDVRTGREVWVNDTVESALPSLLADLYKM